MADATRAKTGATLSAVNRGHSVVRYVMEPGLLRRLSGGQGKRAALILIGAHVGAMLVTLLMLFLIWLVGLAPIFTEARWIPVTLASVVWLVVTFAMLMVFGFWGTPSTGGQGGGYQIEDDFTPGVATGLGWLRWFMQISTFLVSCLALLLIWADMRWYHVVPTPEIEGLPARAAALPFPEDWGEGTGRSIDETFPADVYRYELEFDVPDSYRYADLQKWMSSPEWGESIGALRNVDCDYGDCEAEVVPHHGGQVAYFVRAEHRDYRANTTEDIPITVRVELRYRVP